MKRKVKLFATIACLCLSLALMAFGVYAATQATLTVNSKVTFTALDVYVDFEVELYRGKSISDGDLFDAELVGTKYEASSYTEASGIKTPKESFSETCNLGESVDVSAGTNHENEVLSTTYRACKIIIKVKNVATDKAYVTLTDSSEGLSGTGINFTSPEGTKKVGDENYAAATGIANNETFTFVRYASINDVTTSGTFTFKYTVSVAKTAPTA